MDFKREIWSEILRREALDIDYTNFKNTVHDGTVRDDAYFEAYDALAKYTYNP